MSLVVFDQATFDALSDKARSTDRRRAHRKLHLDLTDKCQRLLIAMEPDSYVRPHRHDNPAKPEMLAVLRGSVAVFIFDDQGEITRAICCDATGPIKGCDIPDGVWHCVTSLQAGSVFLEAKPGPYEPVIREDFAAWSPAEGESGTLEFIEQLNKAL